MSNNRLLLSPTWSGSRILTLEKVTIGVGHRPVPDIGNQENNLLPGLFEPGGYSLRILCHAPLVISLSRERGNFLSSIGSGITFLSFAMFEPAKLRLTKAGSNKHSKR